MDGQRKNLYMHYFILCSQLSAISPNIVHLVNLKVNERVGGLIMYRNHSEKSKDIIDERFPAGAHMCMIFNIESERNEVISNFLEKGLKSREKVGYFSDVTPPETITGWLRELDVDVDSLRSSDQFVISKADETYCPEGRFVPEQMLDRLKSFYLGSLENGYSGARVTGEMTWALNGFPGSEKLIEYEGKINSIIEEYPLTPICQYDATCFDGSTLFNVLKVHPMMVVRGQVVHNPYYIKPEEFL